MKRFLGMAMGALLIPALAGATIQARYRITLRDGTQIVTRDLPVHRGSVVTFHDGRSGALTGLPDEQIVRIETGAATVVEPATEVLERENRAAVSTPAQPMQPGDVVELGPTGGGALLPPNGASPNAAQVQAGSAGNGAYGQPPVGAYGGAYAPGTVGPNGQPMATPNLAAGTPPTVGPNGFPVMSGNPPTIGPNGTPISSSDQPLIGANGTPVTPGTAQPLIGSNGTPALAPSGAPGGTAPVIGPNGTPVLAPAGSPGAAQPAIGPNGTPVLAPAGSPGAAPPNIGTNGTPAAPPPGASPHK